MSEEVSENEELRKAYLLAWVLTGCEDGAGRVITEAVQEVRGHPASSDPHKRSRLLVSAVRRRSLKFPAKCELPTGLANLHRALEPGRSLIVLRTLNILSSTESASILGLEPTGARLQEQKAMDSLDEGTAEALTSLTPSPGKECLDAMSRYTHHESHLSAKNPAMLAVGMAFLLLIAILVWQFTGRAGSFPEEAAKIVEVARKAKQEQFAPVDVKVETLPDWFAMQGFDGLNIPTGLESLNAVGVRTFQHEGETVAQMAVLDGEKNIYMLSFPAGPFGIGGLREDSWQLGTSGRFVSAITERGGYCFLVTFTGTEEEMKSFLSPK